MNYRTEIREDGAVRIYENDLHIAIAYGPDTARRIVEALEGGESAAHEELRAIHAICLDVANCPPVKAGDTLTVRYVKDLAHLVARVENRPAKIGRYDEDVMP